MSAEIQRGGPTTDRVLYTSRRSGSVLEVRHSVWNDDGHEAVSIAFQGVMHGLPRWKFVAIIPREARLVAEAILALADEKGWP